MGNSCGTQIKILDQNHVLPGLLLVHGMPFDKKTKDLTGKILIHGRYIHWLDYDYVHSLEHSLLKEALYNREIFLQQIYKTND